MHSPISAAEPLCEAYCILHAVDRRAVRFQKTMTCSHLVISDRATMLQFDQRFEIHGRRSA